MWKKLAKGIWVLCLVLAIPLGLIKACSIFMFDDCNYKDQLPLYQNLSQDRLEKLYGQMATIFANATELHLSMDKARERYPELSDLNFKHIDIFHKWVVIGGCFDDKAMLFFRGFILTDEAPRITLSYGEMPYGKDVILWPRTLHTADK